MVESSAKVNWSQRVESEISLSEGAAEQRTTRDRCLNR